MSNKSVGLNNRPHVSLRVVPLRRASALCGCVVVLLGWGTALRGESPIALTVRIYNAAGLPSPLVVAAREAAEPILRDVGLQVAFRYCGVRFADVNTVVDRCDEALKPGEVIVRIIDTPPPSPTLNPLAYGISYIARHTDTGWLATVFADRVVSAASRVGLEQRTFLGLVLAHEVGHLLLGESHADVGLMRAQWPDAELNRAAAAWRFTPDEAATLQARIQDR